MGSEKEALGKDHQGDVPLTRRQWPGTSKPERHAGDPQDHAPPNNTNEALPSYQDIDGAQGPRDDARPVTDEKAPPEYHDEKKPLGEKESPPKSEKTKITIKQHPSLKIPFTATYLLGQHPHLCNPINGAHNHIDPRIFAFELVCLVCFDYESECSCRSTNPVTIGRTTELPRFRKTEGTAYPQGTGFTQAWPAFLAKELGKGDSGVQVAAAVAHSTWEAMTVGMIPVFGPFSLVVLRSRTLDKVTRSRDIVAKMRVTGTDITMTERPDLAAQACKCCQQHICKKILSKYGMPLESPQHKACTKTAYLLNRVIYTLTRLNSPTSTEIEPLTIVTAPSLPDLLPIPTSIESDFLTYTSLLPLLGKDAKPLDPRLLDWDRMAASLLNEVLTCYPFYSYRLQRIHSMEILLPGIGDGVNRVVLRAENFCAGAGWMVMEIPILTPHLNDGRGSNFMMTTPKDDMCGPAVLKDGFLGPKSSGAGTVMRDCKVPQGPGGGWAGLTVDSGKGKRTGDPLGLKFTAGIFQTKKLTLGTPAWPRRGWPCNGSCLKSGGPLLVAHAGFTPPDPKSKSDTTVYRVSVVDPAPWGVVCQYAASREDSWYVVDGEACLACTVLQAPKGSVIGAVVGRNGSLIPGVERDQVRYEVGDVSSKPKPVTTEKQ